MTDEVDESNQAAVFEQEKTPLLPARPTSSTHPYQAFIRWLACEDVLDKIAMMCLSGGLQHQNNASLLEKIKSNLYYFFRGSSYPRPSKPLLNDASTQRYAVANDFLKGAGIVTEKIWPLIFLALQIHDFAVYDADPQNRFGNTAGHIWAGTSPNQLTLSSHLGSDLPGTSTYYLYPSLILGAALVGGVMQRVLSWKQDKISQHLSEWYWIENTEGQRKQDLESLTRQSVQGSFIEKIKALKALGVIADNFSQRSLSLTGHPRLNLDQEKSEALNALFQSQHVYAKYLIWSLGESKNIFSHVVFTPMALYVIYAKARLLQIIIEKILGLAKYNQEKKQCETNQKQWTYEPNFGDYVCAVCPDWLFVFYKDIFTDQSCLDGLMSVTRPSSMILSHIDKVLVRSNISTLDLSKQHPENWNATDWSLFLKKVGDKIAHLKTINFSQPFLNAVAPQEPFVVSLKNFLNNISVDVLDLNNLGLGDDFMLELIPAIVNASVEELTVSGNYLTDESAFGLSEGVSGNFSKLDFSHNQVSDSGVKALADNLSQSQLETFVSQSNAFGADGLSSLAEQLPLSKIKTCDVSNNDLSNADMDKFGKAVSNTPSLEMVDLSDTHLNDDQVSQFSAHFKSSQLKAVDFSGNNFGDSGLYFIFNQSQGSNINTLLLSRLSMTDAGLQLISFVLPKTLVRKIDLSRCRGITVSGLKQFFNQVLNTTSDRWSINLSENQLGDDIADALAQSFAQSASSLAALYLRNNVLTDKSSEKLWTLFSHKNTTEVDLSHNQLSDVAFENFAKSLPNSSLISINFNQNIISGNISFEIFVKNLPNSLLRQLSLSNNQLRDQQAKSLAQQLVKPKPPIKNLGEHLSVDEARALVRSHPNTALTRLDLSSNQIGSTGASALCEVLGSTDIEINNLNLANNPINSQEIDLASCRQVFAASAIFMREPPSHSTHLQPKGFLPSGLNNANQNQSSSASSYVSAALIPGVGTVILGFIALYLIYVACRPLFNRTWNNSSNFFKPDNSADAQPCQEIVKADKNTFTPG